ncbi:Golgi phosphoprotein 3-domain-containing protein [Zopfochytrium polystomum]|nr:Golgi phosphoprotein 3-domain-containing protein [Zopfochytrium polystomum]
MASSAGLTQRRRNFAAAANDDGDGPAPSTTTTATDRRDSANSDDDGAGANNREQYYDDDDDKTGKKGGGNRQNDLTILEEVLLMGLKDAQGYLSFWNDNISYVLRGAILLELSFRNRIGVVKEARKRPFAERLVEVIDDRPTGEVLLDEALKLMKMDSQSVASWIDLMSGETWNLMKIGYQLKQVRERIAKGLVDKGVLRTEKRNFVLFDMATHPVSDPSVKEKLIRRSADALLGRGPAPDRRTVAMLCAAYAANVLENALMNLSHAQREQAFVKVDEMLQEYAGWSDRARQGGATEVMAGVFSVYTKMDSLL